MAATEHVPRVALLARAGAACDNIDAALRRAGAEVVLVADPVQSGPEALRAALPEAILVALDPAIEDAIERYDDVLADPAYLVIFEEAEQAAQRTGWDAARWLRHLSAKLHRHHDVLPAGAGVEEELHPVPGPMPGPASEVDYENAIVAFTGEARQLADVVPADSGLDGLSGSDEAGLEADASTFAFELEGADDASAAAPSLEFDGLTLEDGGQGIDASVALADEEAALDGVELSLADFILEAGSHLELAPDGEAGDPGSPASLADALQFAADGAADAGDIDAFDGMAFDAERFQRLGQAEGVPAGIEEFLAAQIQRAPRDADAESGEAPAAESAPAPKALESFDLSALSLADDDAAPLSADRPKATASFDLSALSLADEDAAPLRVDRPKAASLDLDALGSGLSLADPDSYGHGPLRGLILIEAGLGGPDAVRQLLAAIPEALPRPILIHLPLEGGRYDRLVKQMTRATAAPVCVATANAEAEPGSIYFVPPELGLKTVGASWIFDASTAFDPARDLPPEDSAVLVLSGAERARIAGLVGGGWDGLLLGQTPDEGCYDPVAAQAAISAGAAHGTPAELAARLIQRWLPPATTPNDDPSGMLQP